jgi:hypothetical protein
MLLLMPVLTELQVAAVHRTAMAIEVNRLYLLGSCLVNRTRLGRYPPINLIYYQCTN